MFLFQINKILSRLIKKKWTPQPTKPATLFKYSSL